MKFKIRTTLFFLLASSMLTANAQTLSRVVIGSTGSINERLSYTVGETVIKTGNVSDLMLTQGFQQPDDLLGTLIDPFLGSFSFHLYPNPAKEDLFLELEPSKPMKLTIAFTDARGRRVLPDKQLDVREAVKLKLDVGTLATGTYMMILRSEDGKGVKSFRFQKIY